MSTFYVRSSIGWVQDWLWGKREEFDSSDGVSMAVQNMVGRFFQPMGIVIRMATRGSSSSSVVKTRVVLGVLIGLRSMR